MDSDDLWITLEITLSEGHSVYFIDISSVRLEGIKKPDSHPQTITQNTIKLKYLKAELIDYLKDTGQTSGNVLLTVTGVVSGRLFEGSETIRVY